jgi:hypothetical protein
LAKLSPYDSAGKPISVEPENGDVLLDIPHLAADKNRLFLPYTTTLIEIRISRETLPLDAASRLLDFLDDKGHPPSQESGGWLSRIL